MIYSIIFEKQDGTQIEIPSSMTDKSLVSETAEEFASEQGFKIISINQV